MALHRPVLGLVAASSLVLLVTVSCGVGSGGGEVPPLASDFTVGATVPGWVLSPSGGSRGEVLAQASHDGQRWSVLLERPLERQPRDARFALAMADNGPYHSGIRNLHLTFEPGATSAGDTVAAVRVPDGQITLDGVIGGGEWPTSAVAMLTATPQNDLPSGEFVPAANVDVLAVGAWDSEYVYLRFQWIDNSAGRSDLGPQLQWDGAQWVRRPHAANDTNGNGVLDPGETMNVAATADDEDRFMLMWPIQDEADSFAPGGQGCADSCHDNVGLAATGSEAVHALGGADDRWDVWSWGAARTGPALRMEDRSLGFANSGLGFSGGGSGLLFDVGDLPSVAQGFPVPDTMFVQSPGGQQALIGQSIDFSAVTPAGFPVPGPVVANGAPYAPASFNNSGGGPQAWTGSPGFQDDYLPAWVMQPAGDDAADVEAVSGYGFGVWTLEIRRKRVTRDASGAPRTDDVQFDDDADFLGAVQQLVAAQGLPFSISITDGASGHGVRESRFQGPLRLSGDSSLAGPMLTDTVYVHDYGPGFSPSSEGDFTDPRYTSPLPDAGGDVGARLRAGSDGATLYLSVSWDDGTVDRERDTWMWNGFTWEQGGGQDELRLLFNGTTSEQAFVQGGGCAYLCHGPGGGVGVGVPAGGPWFGADRLNDSADLWHWQAGRTDPLGMADDATVDWRSFGAVTGGAPNAAVRGDDGPSPYEPNRDPALTHPVWMSPGDPNASAPFLAMGVPGFPDAIPFMDVLAGLPVNPMNPGGPGPTPTVSFQNEVVPIFQANCTVCHPPYGGLDLTSYENIMSGGQSGAVVVPGDPNGSLLLQRINGNVTPQMPLGGNPLPASDIQLISDWIAEGALNN